MSDLDAGPYENDRKNTNFPIAPDASSLVFSPSAVYLAVCSPLADSGYWISSATPASAIKFLAEIAIARKGDVFGPTEWQCVVQLAALPSGCERSRQKN